MTPCQLPQICLNEKQAEESVQKNVYIYGSSGHAKVVSNILTLNGCDVGGYIDDFIDREVFDLPDGKKQMTLEYYLAHHIDCPVALGFGNCAGRERAGNQLLAAGVTLQQVIHPRAEIAGDVKLGRGVCLCAGVVIDPGCVLGDFVIVNNQACVCHDSQIGVAAHLAPGVMIAGNVCVGPRSWIGIGSAVKEKIAIGSDVMVGAGSVVIRDIKDRVKCYGNPAHKNIFEDRLTCK